MCLSGKSSLLPLIMRYSQSAGPKSTAPTAGSARLRLGNSVSQAARWGFQIRVDAVSRLTKEKRIIRGLWQGSGAIRAAKPRLVDGLRSQPGKAKRPSSKPVSGSNEGRRKTRLQVSVRLAEVGGRSTTSLTDQRAEERAFHFQAQT